MKSSLESRKGSSPSLLRHMRPYRLECVLGPLLKLAEATLELIVPLVIARLIDVGIANGDRSYVIRMALLLVLLGACGLAFSVTAQYFAAKASVGFVTGVRHTLFSHIQRLSYTELDTLGSSTLITRLTGDTNQVQSGLNLALRLLLRSPFVVFGAMIMAFTIDVRSALTFAEVIPALSIVVFGIMLISIPLYRRVQGRLDRILAATRENLSGVRVIRAFCQEEDEVRAFREKHGDLTAAQTFVGRISALLNPLTYVLINLAIILLIYSGALQVKAGDLTQGEVVALYNYMSQILVELIKLANLIINITKALACAGRIRSVLAVEPSMVYGTRPYTGEGDEAVAFDNVSLTYKGAGDASLSGLTFRAGRGETVGIIGGTGSGKSTLVNLIPRFYDASVGTVRIDGHDVREYDRQSLRRGIAVVPQKAVLFSGTIRENMKWGADATDAEIEEALRIAQATQVVADKGGLDARVEQGGRNFSGGQRQRLTIARALVKRPRILILDDSASALDYATDAALRKSIREMGGGTTVFIVSQRASSLMYADRIIVLEDGAPVGIGTHEQLLQSCPVYREIYETQFPSDEGEVKNA